MPWPDGAPLLDPVVKEIAENHNKTSAQVLLRYVLQNGRIAIPKKFCITDRVDHVHRKVICIRLFAIPLQYAAYRLSWPSSEPNCRLRFTWITRPQIHYFGTGLYPVEEKKNGETIKMV
ncbi:unnamed protein product, partial [Cylicostephanus goldi]